MNDYTPQDPGSAPTIEVTVYRDGTVIHRERCESEEDAAAAIERWTEIEGVECEIDDLSVHHRAGEILEPSESVPVDEDYRPESETREG